MAVASSAEQQPPEAPTQGRRRRARTSRPEISLQQPRSWHRALPPGVVPAYDLALQLLQHDSRVLKQEIASLQESLKEKEAAYQALQSKAAKASAEEKVTLEENLRSIDQEMERMLEKLNILEVQSEVNLPDVRWSVNNAMGPSFFEFERKSWSLMLSIYS